MIVYLKPKKKDNFLCRIDLKTLKKIFRIELEDIQDIVYLLDGNRDFQLGLYFFLPLPNRVEVSFNNFYIFFVLLMKIQLFFFVFYHSSAVKLFFSTKLKIKLV